MVTATPISTKSEPGNLGIQVAFSWSLPTLMSAKLEPGDLAVQVAYCSNSILVGILIWLLVSLLSSFYSNNVHVSNLARVLVSCLCGGEVCKTVMLRGTEHGRYHLRKIAN